MINSFKSKSELETQSFGKLFSEKLVGGEIVILVGDLGAGKTEFMKGVCVGLKVAEKINSPTFTIVTEHRSGRIPVFHFDFYRIETEKELEEFGFNSYLEEDGIIFIEWGNKFLNYLPKNKIEINFKHGQTINEREISINYI